MRDSMACKCKTVLFVALVVIGLMVVGSTAAMAQDVYQTNYFSNGNTAGYDAKIRINNPGVSGTDLCANIYAFDDSQELKCCASCAVTTNGMRTLSVNVDLEPNFNNGPAPNGTVAIVSGAPGALCDPTSVTPTPALRTWANHVQNFGGNLVQTETTGLDVTLTAAELGNLETQCYYLLKQGSGIGKCGCGFEF